MSNIAYCFCVSALILAPFLYCICYYSKLSIFWSTGLFAAKTRINAEKHSSWCKSCAILRSKNHAKINPTKREGQDKKYCLKKKFNLGVAEYDTLLKKQNGVYAICKKVEIRKNSRLYVDHCHHSHKIRGLLCRCRNPGLGYFYDTPSLLENTINYLQKKTLRCRVFRSVFLLGPRIVHC
jgi:hypothetical protein